MKNGQCPKCHESQVFHLAGHHAQSEKVTLKVGVISKGTAPDRYICGSGGYVEFYLAFKEDLQLVRQTWAKVAHSS